MAEPKILLSEWAKRQYDPPPSDWVLNKWVRRGEVLPEPELVGKRYYVEPTARRITAPASAGSLVRRLRAVEA